MDLEMDAHVLLSLVNTRLRNDHASLEALADAYDIDTGELEAKLGGIGYTYDTKENRFVAKPERD